MIDPKKIDLNQLPKKFCDGAIGAFNKDIFVIALTSGNELTPFATSPQIAKSISLWLAENVVNYEKQFGAIDMNQTPPVIESPFNSSDLSGSNKKTS